MPDIALMNDLAWRIWLARECAASWLPPLVVGVVMYGAGLGTRAVYEWVRWRWETRRIWR